MELIILIRKEFISKNENSVIIYLLFLNQLLIFIYGLYL